MIGRFNSVGSQSTLMRHSNVVCNIRSANLSATHNPVKYAFILAQQQQQPASIPSRSFRASASISSPLSYYSQSNASGSSFHSASRRSAASNGEYHLQQPFELTDHVINQYADKPARPVSLKLMLEMGRKQSYLLTAAQWLWAELPVRLAKRLRDLDDLPFGLSKSVEVQSLMALYRASLTEALSIRCPHNTNEEMAFTECIKRILTRHEKVIVDLASGINGGFLRSGSAGRPANQHFVLQEFLDRFNAARIGLRMLMAQHVALHNPRPNHVGVIEIGCDPTRIVKQAVEDATTICKTAYGIAPHVEITDTASKVGGIKNFNYVAAHLRFMVFELLKNAMKATVEHTRKKKGLSAPSAAGSASGATVAGELQEKDLPPIQVVIVDGPTDVTIKISDRGGGIKRSELPLVFTYTYSATQKSLAQQQAQLAQAKEAHQRFVTAAQAAAAAAGHQFSSPLNISPSLNNSTNSSSSPSSSSSSSSSSTSSSSFSNSASSIAAAVGFPDPVQSSSSSSSDSTPDWRTGANFQPMLNATHNDFIEAFGLPITRLLSRYLGGDLQLFSLNNFGTDAILFINRLGDHQEIIQD